MKYTNALIAPLMAGVASSTQATLVNSSRKLRLSAVINDPSPPYHARIECWELHNHFSKYPTIGSSLQLADVTNVTYVELPAGSEGQHNAPHPMLFVLLSGSAEVTLPFSPSFSLEIKAGEHSVIVATDTIGPGHYTRYSGDRVAALQVPFENGLPPKHEVLHQGQCSDI